MKQIPSWFTHGVPGGATLRRQIIEASHGHEVMDRVEAFFTTGSHAACDSKEHERNASLRQDFEAALG